MAPQGPATLRRVVRGSGASLEAETPPMMGPSPKGQGECEVPGQQLGSSYSRTHDCLSMLPRSLRPQLGNQDSWVISTVGMEHSETLNHPWMPPGRAAAPWLPSPPDPALPSCLCHHSTPGPANTAPAPRHSSLTAPRPRLHCHSPRCPQHSHNVPLNPL